MNTKYEIGNLSDLGRVRSSNEDYYGSYTGAYGSLLIVCDGMGGHIGGQEASRIAVESIKNHFLKLGQNYNTTKELYEAIVEANKNILLETKKKPELKGMGSTAVILLIKEQQIFYAHIGDSRIYLIRENRIYQLTKDHSLLQKLIDSGIVAEENAADYPNKNVIVKALGEKDTVDPDIAGPMTVFKGDKFILCSDGLTAYLNKEEILRFTLNDKPQNAAQKLVDTANERGGKDNITIQIVNILNGKRLPNKVLIKMKQPKVILLTFSILLFVFASAFIFKYLVNFERVSNNVKTHPKELIKKDSVTVDPPSKNIDNLKSDSLKEEKSTNSTTNIKLTKTEDVSRNKSVEEKKTDGVIYVVKKGDTVSSIAIHFNVKQDELKKWNNLEDNKIKIGQKLIIRKR